MITIDHALHDPKLLGGSLGAPETWATWMAILKAAFGITLSDAERHAFESVAGSREPPARKVE